MSLITILAEVMSYPQLGAGLAVIFVGEPGGIENETPTWSIYNNQTAEVGPPNGGGLVREIPENFRET